MRPRCPRPLPSPAGAARRGAPPADGRGRRPHFPGSAAGGRGSGGRGSGRRRVRRPRPPPPAAAPPAHQSAPHSPPPPAAAAPLLSPPLRSSSPPEPPRAATAALARHSPCYGRRAAAPLWPAPAGRRVGLRRKAPARPRPLCRPLRPAAPVPVPPPGAPGPGQSSGARWGRVAAGGGSRRRGQCGAGPAGVPGGRGGFGMSHPKPGGAKSPCPTLGRFFAHPSVKARRNSREDEDGGFGGP